MLCCSVLFSVSLLYYFRVGRHCMGCIYFNFINTYGRCYLEIISKKYLTVVPFKNGGYFYISLVL